MTAAPFVVAGVAAAAVETALLARSPRVAALTVLARVALVGVVLFVSAREGHLAATASAWAIAFAAFVFVEARRRR